MSASNLSTPTPPGKGPGPIDVHTPIPVAWKTHAGALAAWASAHLVNRRDAYGQYLPPEQRAPDRSAITAKGEPTRAILQRHFRGEDHGHIIGLHSTVRDEPSGEGETAACWSRWTALDIDRHDPATDPEKTRAAAVAWHDRAAGLGFRPLLIDSNGDGGYHLRIVFDAPIPSEKAHAFGLWLSRDWEALGMDDKPEVFPKQASIPAGGFGNWLRLPGRHHTRDHFSRVWDGTTWLEGTAAIKVIVGTKGDPPGLIPAEATEKPRKARPKARSGPLPFAPEDDAALAASALEALGHLADDYGEWLKIGLALTPLGEAGLALWDDWSRRSPKYEEGACDRKWRSFKRDGGVTLGTLFQLAKSAGWEFPRRSNGQANGHHDPGVNGTATAASDPGPSPAKDRGPAGPINLTDTGNSLRLARDHGDKLRYCVEWGKWLCWDGRRWKEDKTGGVYRMARRTIRRMVKEAIDCPDPDDRKALLKWAVASESRKHIDAMIHLARFVEGIPVETSQLDRDPWALNVRNGTVDLRTGELRAHRREDLMTKLAEVDYDPAATCPRWDQFESEIMDGDPAMVAYLRRVAGYGITGDVREHQLYFLHGEGRNGKSLWIEIIQGILNDYATTINSSLITAKQHDDHPTGLTDLEGRRFVSTIEVSDGRKMAEALVKQLTGGDRIKARRMRQDFYEFCPTHKIILAANHKPTIRETGEAIWERIKLIPFPVTFVEADRVNPAEKLLLKDKGLRDKLQAEAPGILAALVRACLDWQREGMNEPEAVVKATAGYRAEQDRLNDFIADRCIVAEGVRAKANTLYEAYKGWAKASGESEMPKRIFGSSMERRGFKNVSSNSHWWRHGIALRVDEDEHFRDVPSSI